MKGMIMLNKLLNLFGYHAIVVPTPTATSIYDVTRYWSQEIGFDSETDQKIFNQVTNLFNVKGERK